jgi:hypothetical protein
VGRKARTEWREVMAESTKETWSGGLVTAKPVDLVLGRASVSLMPRRRIRGHAVGLAAAQQKTLAIAPAGSILTGMLQCNICSRNRSTTPEG